VSTTAPRKNQKSDKSVFQVPTLSVYPSPENDDLYRPVDPADPEIIALASSISENGILEPLVVTLDDYLLSGHRRLAGAKIAGLETVPVRRKQIRRLDDIDRFVRLLREHNRQRPKSRDERLREELIAVSPEEAYQSLIAHRQLRSEVVIAELELDPVKRRRQISDAKQSFLDAILRVLDDRRAFWPLSVRQIHYALLNFPPLKHASKPTSIYDNTIQSYKSLDELTVRARLLDIIPPEAIDDETRPVVLYDVHREAAPFIAQQFDRFLRGYWRDLMQSQPNHVEIVVEKNTVASIIKDVATEYCIPMTSGRGFCSLPPRMAMRDRFRKSGKQRLVVLMATDFDPAGEQIARSFCRSMRDEMHIDIVPVKVALTQAQALEHKLPENSIEAKETTKTKKGPGYAKFVHDYGAGHSVYELEALEPLTLRGIMRDAIDAVIDREAFNRELDEEKQDAAHLERVRLRVIDAMRDAIAE
jgi:hypothetical protein